MNKFGLLFAIFLLTTTKVFGQQFAHFASATYIQTCNSAKFYNNLVERAAPDCINPQCDTIFEGKNFGAFFKNSQDLILRGGELKTERGTNSNVCGSKLYYTIYPEGARPAFPVFLELNLPHASNCNLGTSTFQDNFGPCIDRDQKWGSQAYNVDLTNFNQGNYALEVFFEAFGSHNSTSLCDDTISVTNGSSNFVAFFQIVDVSITADGPTTFCEGENVTLTSSMSSGNLWNTGATTQSIEVNSSGTYNIMIPSLNACETTNQASINVSVNPLPNVSAGSNITICEGSEITLNGNGANIYIWDNNITNGVPFVPISSGTYTVIGTNSTTLCSNQASVDIIVVPNPISSISTVSQIVGTGSSVLFFNNSTNALNYTWNFNNGDDVIVTDEISNQSTVFNNTGDYYVTLTANNGSCVDVDSILITVKIIELVNFDTPNIFTPNGDGENDSFTMNIKNAKSVQISILNRWGEIIHEINDIDSNWDGKFEGKPVSDGIYFYIYTIVDESDVVHKGHHFLTLLREK